MLKDLNAILDYMAELNELDTTGIAPLAQISELVDAAEAWCAPISRNPR